MFHFTPAPVVTNPNGLVIYDVCETAQPTSGFYTNQRPPEVLIGVLKRIRRHYILCPVTGQTIDVVQRLARMLDMSAFYLSAVEFGAQVVNKRRGIWMLDEKETQFLVKAKTALLPFMRNHGAEADPRDLSGFFSYWFHREGDPKADSMLPEIKTFLDEHVAGWDDHIVIHRWPRGEVLFKPKSLTKKLAVDHLTNRGYNVLIGAGDTPSDLPLIEAARFGIVTHIVGEEPNPRLIEAAQRCPGGYYVAKPDEPHGYGLAAGLLAARDAGVLSF